MPIYEYRCEACDHQFEVLQKISDRPLHDCPSCTKLALKKLLSATAFRLGGEGWYETDFKQGKKKNISGDTEIKASVSEDKHKPVSTGHAVTSNEQE